MRPTAWRSTASHCGAGFAPHHCVRLVSPSTAYSGSELPSKLEAVTGLPSARFVACAPA